VGAVGRISGHGAEGGVDAGLGGFGDEVERGVGPGMADGDFDLGFALPCDEEGDAVGERLLAQ
jgi:hypothetical protein